MKINTVIYVIIIGLFASCASSRNAQDMTDPAELSTTYNELADYLRRVPGVLVTGSSGNYSVLIRGISSISGSNEPLYVIDRNQVGSYNQAAAMIDPNDIAYVEVLKDVASTTAYGMRGANGVIIIHTKK
ncbi:MAG: TonB-dependent receptor plug domain-containing protein [Bacteroidetes bacterium]|nr:TonB-dependent receptor plug domain-containing protein [Bacteroidota bacterium]